jgi:hypothetical protein
MLIVVRLNVAMMNVAMLIVIGLNDIMLSVFIVKVVVPFSLPETEKNVLKIACLAHKLRCYKTF